jgi:hypothetical protein
VTRLSQRVNQVVVPASIPRLVVQFSCRRAGSGGLGFCGHDVRVNYVGGSAASLETLAAACFCR